jgi:[NiFe] hydrogenase maturation protein HypF
MTDSASVLALRRSRVVVRGIVQGVGFRPFVHRLATELALAGWVRNDGGGVTVEVEGDADAVAALVRRIHDEAPPLARIDALHCDEQPPTGADRGFAIMPSAAGRATTAIGPDSAVCDDCLAELLAPADRRHRYAFVNCTHCGPRYTITDALPYDRASTSMARFQLCADCRREYEAPANRRFHAEPNACPACGPRLWLAAADGADCAATDPVAAAVAHLARGEIVAIKGLGGFHLACDARNAAAVAALRARKGREEKPFAVMVASLASVPELAVVTAADAQLLAARERPIVLLRKAAGCDDALPGVAPGLAWLGVMLPYTPLHYLLFHEAAGRPPGTGWLALRQPTALVMTSANPGGEPLVTGNDEALARLAGIADAFLLHDRDIVIRCDDSVVRAAAAGSRGPLQFVRRARGYTPRAIALAASVPPVLATGGHFKNTVCVTRGDEAFVSEHVGDLDNAPTCVALEQTVEHLLSILDVRPVAVAHDLHPDYHSSRLAARLAAEWSVPLLPVQHHHAHVAAILAEHRVEGPVLGLALDGVGLGVRRHGVGRRAAAGRRRGFPAPRAPAAAAAARRRPRRARTVADGCGGAAPCRQQRADRRALCRRAGLRDGVATAGARLQRAADDEPRPLVRCGGGAARRPATDGLRRAGGDAARRPRGAARSGRCGAAVRLRCRRHARPVAAARRPCRLPRAGLRRGAVPRHRCPGTRRVGRAGRGHPLALDRRRRRRLHAQRRSRRPVARRTCRAGHRAARSPRGATQRRRHRARAGVGRLPCARWRLGSCEEIVASGHSAGRPRRAEQGPRWRGCDPAAGEFGACGRRHPLRCPIPCGVPRATLRGAHERASDEAYQVD